MDQVNQTIAGLSAQLFRVRGQVGDNSDDRFVDWLEQAWSRLHQLVDREEDQVVVGDRIIDRHVKLDLRLSEGLVEGVGELTGCRDRQ